jgi:hypothetical protein
MHKRSANSLNLSEFPHREQHECSLVHPADEFRHCEPSISVRDHALGANRERVA